MISYSPCTSIVNHLGMPTAMPWSFEIIFNNYYFLAAPENVEILLEDGRTATRNVSRIGPFNEGTTVTLLCRSGGGRPVPHIEWWNGTQVLDGI